MPPFFRSQNRGNPNIFSHFLLLQLTPYIITRNPNDVLSVIWKSRFFSESVHSSSLRSMIFAFHFHPGSKMSHLGIYQLTSQFVSRFLRPWKIKFSSTHAYWKGSGDMSVWSFADWRDWAVSNRSFSKMYVPQHPSRTYQLEPNGLWLIQCVSYL